MLKSMLLALAVALSNTPICIASPQGNVFVLHTYEARIRLKGNVSTTTVQASSAGQAKKLVQAQFGPEVTVLSVKRID